MKISKAGLQIFLGLFLLSATAFSVSPDYVNTSKIGLPSPYFYNMYSGYLNASTDGTKQFHYVFYPAQSTNVTQLPLILWLNGGPGCSRYTLLDSPCFILWKSHSLIIRGSASRVFWVCFQVSLAGAACWGLSLKWDLMSSKTGRKP